MKKGRTWSRIVAIVLASVMLLTDQSVTLAADVIADTQTQDSAGTGSGATNTDPAASGEQSSPDVTYSEEENGATQQTGQTPDQAQSQPQQSAPAQTQSQTQSQPQQSTPAQTQSQPQQSAPAQTQPAGPQELTLTDEETGVRVIGMDNVLPEGAALSVDEKKEEEDTDYPAQAKEDIATKLEQEENLSLTDIAFYDINLGGGQPSDKIEVRFSVPDDWTGELDAWYIDDQGKVTNMDGEKNETEKYFAFQTDHFSLYALSVSEPKEEEKAEEKKDEEKTAKQNLDAGNDAAVYETVKDMAEAYYGEDATDPHSVGEIFANRYDSLGNGIKAGDVLTFRINYHLFAAPTFNYSEAHEPIFDTYDKTTIRVKLPDGIRIIDTDEGDLAGIKSATEDPNKPGEWILTLESESISAATDTGRTFYLNLLVEDNGAVPVGEKYIFSNDFVTLDTSFDVLDRSSDNEVVGTYSDSVVTESYPENLIATSDDTWGIEKSFLQNDVKFEDGKVTVPFELKVGLTDKDGKVLSDASAYNVHGRAPFENNTISITENLAVQNKEGKGLTPESVTITPQFGQDPQAVSVTNGGTAELPIRMEEVDTDTYQESDTPKEAPYYSTYRVEAVYDAEDFIDQYYEEDQDKLEVTNTAELSCLLEEQNTPQTDSATATGEVGDVTDPAKLTIEKYINGTLYTKANPPVSGPATFTVTKKDGTAATLYVEKDGKYVPLTGNTVSINPAGSDDGVGTNGTITVYLDPGTYVVTETGKPANTEQVTEGTNNANAREVELTKDTPVTTAFYNKEVLGSLTIEKTGTKEGKTDPLPGVEYELYDKENPAEDDKPVASGTTAAVTGSLTFSRLAYGTYYLKEVSAPEGYEIAEGLQKVEITGADPNQTLELDNLYNSVEVTLQKQYMNYTENKYENVNNSNYAEFNGAFTLEQKVGDSSWETVKIDGTAQTGLGLSVAGTIVKNLPVYDENEALITYRFKEELPEGWHAENEKDGVVYSEEFNLAEELKGEGEKTITMQNTRNGSFHLTKTFLDMTTTGDLLEVNNKEATFTLYQQAGNGDILLYTGDNPTGTYTTQNGTLDVRDLPRIDSTGQSYKYYWVETGTAGYELQGTSAISVGSGNKQSVEALGPYDFTTAGTGGTIQLAQTIEAVNVQQKVPVKVLKENSHTGEFVPGAKYTIYQIDPETKLETAVAGCENIEVVENGTTSLLETGYEYVLRETTVPDGYENELEDEGIKIDLTKTKVTEEGVEPLQTYTLKNKPDPTVVIKKTVKGADGQPTPLNNVSFEVYTYDEDTETFTQVKDYDGKTPLKLTSGQAKMIKPGTYYLKETAPNGVLDPSKYSTLYEGGIYSDKDNAFYFGPYTVEEDTDGRTQDLGTIVNLSEDGAVKITKTAADTKKGLQGATLEIYRKDEDTVVALGPNGTPLTVTTGTDGTALFEDLPIYDESGTPYTYYVKETKAPEGYELSGEELSFTLEAGTTVTTDQGGQTLEIVDQPLTSFQVNKVYYNVWEHRFTNKEYTLPGTTIALYKKEADGSYTLEDKKVTDELGTVTFTDLTQEDEYIAVEVSVPDNAAYAYLEPIDEDKVYLDELHDTIPETLTAEEAAKVYSVTKLANNDPAKPVDPDPATMTNVENWAQLQIHKWEYPGNNETEKPRPIDHAEFTLYQQIVEGNETTLTFDEENLDQYTEIGSYSSGTFYDDNGIRQEGDFATDILKAADNVVYWLVETYAGPGSEIKPENRIILFVPAALENVTNVSGEKDECTRVEVYQKNSVTAEDVQNLDVDGPGDERFASVRIAKWADDIEGSGNYTPLGNVKFDLWLVDKDGNHIEKLDVLTTGLDNDLSGEGEPENLKAWAQSRSLRWKTLVSGLLGSEEAEVGTDDNKLIWMDEHGNGYIRVSLEEVSAPGGYKEDTGVHHMLLCFAPPEKVNGSSTTFNDVYYVTQAEAGSEKLASTQPADEWSAAAYEEVKTADGKTELKLVENIDGNGQKYRLVNYPQDNFAVTLRKYGYTPVAGADGTVNKTSEELDEYFAAGKGERKPLKVTMQLQKKNEEGKWVNYDYDKLTWANSEDAAQFTTEDGTFEFPSGLMVGDYRILEVTGDAAYENIYTGNNGREFSVVDENVTLSMYNPRKLSLSIKKTDMDGQPLVGVTFTLTPVKGGTKVSSSASGADGVAEIQNITSGFYQLSESGSGISTEYLSKYFQETYGAGIYKGLASFPTSTGVQLGYTTRHSEGDTILTGIYDQAYYGISSDVELAVENPRLVELTVKKVDEQDHNTVLEGATFKVERQAFSGISGNLIMTGGTWIRVEASKATGENGTFTLTGLQPGLYRITELNPRQDYEKTDVTTQLIAVTGGMDITSVTYDNEKVTLATGVGEGDGKEAIVTFENRKLVNLNITKEITGLDRNKDYTFEFTLYSDDQGNDKAGTATVTVAKDQEQGTATIQGLSQGKTYYLEETSYDKAAFALTEATLTGRDKLETVTVGDRTLYKVVIPKEQAAVDSNYQVNVTVENQYLYAQVTFLKIDGDTLEPLTGAEFAVDEKTDAGAWAEVNADRWKITDGETDGEYTLRIRLSGNKDQTFQIRETKAPDKYILKETPAEEITLSPGETQKYAGDWKTGWTADNNTDLVIPNYEGTHILLTKYDNVPEAATKTPMEGVSFRIYNQTSDGSWTPLNTTYTTDGHGQISLTLPGDSKYAIAETSNVSGYKGLEGIYPVTEGQDGEKLTTITSGGTTLWLLNGNENLRAGETYEYHAYNEPYVSLRIEKRDVSGSSVVPQATVSVYEVPDDTPAELDEDALQEAIESGTPLVEDVETTGTGEGFSYADSTTTPQLGTAESGKTYLVVETAVSGQNGTYDTLIKDDNRVVWYGVCKIDRGDTSQRTIQLKNVLGKAEPSLTKKADHSGTLDSLMEGGQTLSYTLTPGAGGNTYGLDSYVITDSGLSAWHGTGQSAQKLNFDQYLNDKYSLTEVKLGAASHDVSMYGLGNDVAANNISATVTFKGFNDEIIDTQTVALGENGATVTLTAGKGKAKSVEISYRSEDLYQEIGYALGQNFQPGTVQITAEVEKQEGSEGAQTIDRIDNTARAKLSYRPWSNAGERQANALTMETPDATASNTFGDVETAEVSVSKRALSNSVRIEGTTTYEITVSNAEDAGAPMLNPVIAELLPEGSTLDTANDGGIRLKNTLEGIDSLEPVENHIGDNTVEIISLKTSKEGKDAALQPGESITIEIDVKADPAVVRYGATLTNYAFVTSTVRGEQSTENPQAASFRNGEGQWPGSLDQVSGDLGEDRLNILKENLIPAIKDYGYVAASAGVPWMSDSEMALIKSSYGDLDIPAGETTGSYSSSDLANVSNGGTVYYQLTASNLSGVEGRTDLTVADILPRVGDKVIGGTDRGSEWPLTFSRITSVTKIAKDGTETLVKDYTLYFYDGNLDNAADYTNLFTTMDTATEGNMPTGWHDGNPTEDTKAFMLVTPRDICLAQGDSLVVQYEATVNGGQDLEPEILSGYSYNNAVNSFALQYNWYNLVAEEGKDPANYDVTLNEYRMGSNTVSVTIFPATTKVGGQVWIDKNENGIRETGETIADVKDYDIVTDMLENIDIWLYTYRGTGNEQPSRKLYEKNQDTDWAETGTFIFGDDETGLLTGALKENATEDGAHTVDGIDPGQLKGKDPVTYQIRAELPKDTGETVGNFGLTRQILAAGKKISRNPEAIPGDEKTDSNFRAPSGTVASDVEGRSERFYLWPSTDWDNTKDLGLILHRDLKLTKTAEDNTEVPVDGATFKVYGPFYTADKIPKTAEALAQYEEDNPDDVQTMTTGDDGTAFLRDLKWFGAYIIEETGTATGYDLDSAAASGANIQELTGIPNAWLLDIPGTDSMVTTDEVKVTNARTTTTDLEIKKDLTGKELTAGAFQFELQDSEGHRIGDLVSNEADGTVTFEEISLKGEGTHTFYIKEVLPEEANGQNPYQGVTYDLDLYKVVVTTTWTAGTGLKVTGIQYEKPDGAGGYQVVGDSLTITNEYKATGSWTPEGTKTLTGRDMKAGEKFEFTVTEKVEGEDKQVSKGTATGGSDGVAADIDFDEISYDLDDVGSHTYTIKEVKGGTEDKGLTYSNVSYEVTVKVTDNGDGTLKAEVTGITGSDNTTSVGFTNTYEPEPITYRPVVTKAVTGNELSADQTFTFKLAKGTFTPADGAEMPADTQAQIKVKEKETTGTVTDNFGEITFKKAGTYSFTITEEKPTQAGFENYDTSQWTLTVVVSDDGNGKLTRKSTVYTKDGVDDGTAAAFENKYTPKPVKDHLTVSKTVEGQELPDDPKYKTFTFTMSMSSPNVDGVTMPEDNTATVMVNKTGEAKTANFKEITFTKAGTYVFRITEDTENLPEGYGKGRVPERRARVVVVDDNGSLKVDSITYYLTDPNDPDDTPNASDFTNYYDTADTGFAPKVTKKLTGDTPPGEKEFTFKLEADKNNPEGATLPDPAQTSVIYEKRIGGASASFNAITFEKAGTFKFTITEEKGQAGDGYTYDEAQWTLTVNVEDEGGKLKVESYSYEKDGEPVQGATAAAFENSYKVTPTEYTPGVTKAMTGADRQENQTYEFTLTPGENNPEGGATITGAEASITVPKDTAAGTEVEPAADDGFGKITFEKAGTYTFTIQENIPEAAATNGNTLNGVTYDNSKWTLTVVVKDNNSQLKVTSHTYAKTGGSSNNDAAKFVNDYEVKPTDFTPDVRKTVTGEIRPAEETFTFTLTADKDNPEDGATFTDGQATVTVLEGGTAAGSLVAPATDKFGAITFEKAGTYKFQIAEEKGNANGYSYDTDLWTLTVVVKDEDGQLVVDKTQTKYERTGETDLTDYALFTNHYEVDSIEYAPQVEKKVDGNVPAGRDAKFQFELKLTKADPTDGLKLKGENGAVMTDQDVLETEVTGENTGTFDEITFTRAGTYSFQITEVTGEDTEGYSYDDHIWTLEVKVKDRGGKLDIESKTYTQTEKGKPTGVTSEDQAEFTNTYDPKETTYTPQIRKEITGDRRSEDQVFDFTLTPDDKNPTGASLEAPDMDKASVTGEDIARFSTITFTEAGTYRFDLSEEKGTEAGYTYDESEWELEIEVKDQGGFLTVVSHTYTKLDKDGAAVAGETSEEQASFTNDYKVKETGYIPEVTKTVTGDVPEGRDAQFRFALTAREDNPEGAVLPADTEVTIEGSGEAKFGEIRFEQAGTYRFDITEINDKLPGYQYDGSVWTLTVVVKDTEHILGVESATYTRQDEATSDVAAFENHYQPGEAAYAPRVTKHVSGDKTPSNATFTFTMQALTDNPEGAAVEGTSASVAGAGQTAFAPITFTKAGTYRFDIREADGHEAGYTYDEHIWRMTVEVADEDGVLTIAEVTYEKLGPFMSNGEAAEFTNEYDEAVSTGGRVKTGDPADFSWPLAGASISALFILILLSWRRKEKASTK